MLGWEKLCIYYFLPCILLCLLANHGCSLGLNNNLSHGKDILRLCKSMKENSSESVLDNMGQYLDLHLQ